MNIGCFGAFNFDNYGDLLLGEANLKFFSEALETSEVMLFSPDYEEKWVAPQHNARSALGMTSADLDAVVVGGGDILTLAPTEEHLADDVSPFSASQWNWMLPAAMAKVKKFPLVINSAGVPCEFNPAESELLRKLHGDHALIAVRDPVSAGFMEAALGREVPVVPDPAFRLPDLYSSEELMAERKRLLDELGIAPGEPYATLQCSPGFLGKNGRIFLESVARFASATGRKLIMIPICYLWGDLAAANEAAEKCARVSRLGRRLSVRQTAALIGGGRWFAGSSLHGCLTAMAFGKPALLITVKDLAKFEGAAQLYPQALVRSSRWDGFLEALYKVDAIEPERVEKMAEDCRNRVLRFEERAAEFIGGYTPDGDPGVFDYDPHTGRFDISDAELEHRLFELQTQYLRQKTRDLSTHREWMRHVAGGVRRDIEASLRGGGGLDTIANSLVRRLREIGGREEGDLFREYADESSPAEEGAPVEPVREPRVSIIVPAHNCWELTRACVESVRRNTYQNYELILIDDASDAEIARKMKALENDNTRVIRNDRRCSYSVNNNRAARLAEGDLLCLLNNDTDVEPGWLEAMVKGMAADPSVGLVGNKHLFPKSGKLHHGGMAFDGKGYPWHLHPNTDPDAPAVNYERDLPCVTFACVLIRTRVYRELKGLDEAYRNGFEDCDFCVRARRRGWRIRYTPASVIYHYGQASPDRQAHDDANWELFRSRWSGKLAPDFEKISNADCEYNRRMAQMASAPDRSQPGIHFAVDFTRGGAFTWALAELIAALVDLGQDVSVAPAARLPGLDSDKRRLLKRLMRKSPRRTFHLKWSHFWASHMKTPLAGEINAEFFCTNYLYSKHGRRLDLWMRHVQVSDNRWLPISGFNEEALRNVGIDPKRMAKAPLGYAPEVLSVLPEGRERAPKDDGHLDLLMVTNSEDLQRYGTDIAVKAFGRAFGRADPVTLHIKDYGAHTGSLELKKWIAGQPDFPKVVWHNKFLPKCELMALYAAMDAVVAPFRGEGFGMKIIDAMALGVPVLMPYFGGPVEYAVAGGFIPLRFKRVPVQNGCDSRSSYIGRGAYWCEVEEESLVEALKGLPGRKKALIEIGNHAREHVLANYSWRAVAKGLIRSLGRWKAERSSRIAVRRAPPEYTATVLIPTHHREPILAKVLDAYRNQDISSSEYEILVVNDHGHIDRVQRVLDRHGEGLNVRLLDNDTGVGGPAAARNLGIEQSRGEILILTGDDIVPENDFVAQHLAIHRRHPELTAACVGRTLWHPELEMTPFMRHLSGAGGQQFNYRGCRHGRPVPFDRFYTSNVSVKRAFVIEEESLFRTIFRMYGYEDIELAYRLHLRGMKLLYSELAVGRHHHAMTPNDFLARQYRVGRMLTLMSLVQPAYVPDDHTAFLRSLEFAAGDDAVRMFMKDSVDRQGRGKELTRALSTRFEEMLNSLPVLNAAGRIGVRAEDAYKHSEWLTAACGPVCDAIGELVLREGMAAEWAENGEDPTVAEAWIRMVALRSVLKEDKAPSFAQTLLAPRTVLDAIFGSHKIPAIFYRLKSFPGAWALLSRLEQSRLGTILKKGLRG